MGSLPATGKYQPLGCFAFVSLLLFQPVREEVLSGLSQLCWVLQEVHQEAEAVRLQSQVGGQLRGGQDASQPMPRLPTAQVRTSRHE
jgi:hypothetical protein